MSRPKVECGVCKKLCLAESSQGKAKIAFCSRVCESSYTRQAKYYGMNSSNVERPPVTKGLGRNYNALPDYE